jgi:glycosyltransferase involved in cell wall biosynthesis
VAPHDDEALTDGLRLLIEQPNLRAELRRRGLAHAARFSWRRCAEETAAVYDEVTG